MLHTLERSVVFAALATATFVLAYLYQRNPRVQRVRGVWIWPALFAILAAHAVLHTLPKDPSLWPWLVAAFLIGIPIGIARGLVFGVEPGEKRGEMLLRPTLLSGAIYLLVFFYNEFEHVFKFGDPNLARFSTAFLVMTAGDSLAVNLTRLFRYQSMTSSLPPRER